MGGNCPKAANFMVPTNFGEPTGMNQILILLIFYFMLPLLIILFIVHIKIKS